MRTALIAALASLVMAGAASAHPATEQFIPIGESPGPGVVQGTAEPVVEPASFLRGLRTHRRMRERAVRERVRAGDRLIADMVKVIYRETDPRLHGAAALSVLAHLEDLVGCGEVVTEGREVLDRLVAQVSRPVRWDLCMERFSALGVTGLVELAPAGTLVGLAKRALKGIELVAVRTPDDLDAARTLLQEHSA